MLLVNKLTAPGGIKRIDLRLDVVRIETRKGENLVYRLVSQVEDSGRSKSGKSERRPV